MTIRTPKSLHEEDWQSHKADHERLRSNTDISERMRWLLALVRQHKPSRILDVGCGSGYFGHLVKEIDSTIAIHGFDISEHALALAAAYDRAYALDIDHKDIPEEDESFDMVVCADVLEHIYDVDHCLKEIWRVLRPSGRAVITTPNFSYLKYRILCLLGRLPQVAADPRHLHVFNHALLARKCLDSGFAVTYSVKGCPARWVRAFDAMFRKTIVLILARP